ncbi:pilus assembly protein TadG-related protein [Streptomyces sp. NBC_01190]|uniref:pilus assembly protein TadG-related protein n=1 Tax=Streptomyces sp. NBC_01190 TaxID=2903767 RepID=UPI00386875A0|nr:Tad domain-containing protein [Streptomyces sp. NBC_01190]
MTTTGRLPGPRTGAVRRLAAHPPPPLRSPHPLHPQHPLRRGGGDRGSGTAAVLIFAIVFMALAGFVVDGGLSISKRERAADIAEQAARYAAEDVDTEALRGAPPGGATPVINTGDCDTRVKQFAEQSGLDPADVAASHCTLADADRVEVTIQLTYQPMLTGFFYDHDVVVHGTAAAESVAGSAN